MNTNPLARTEQGKPFRLVKYFTFTSLVILFAGTIILSVLNIHWARRLQLEKNKDYALLLIENLNHQIFLQFIIPTILKEKRIQLREKSQFEMMDKVVRGTLHGFNVNMVNIYDLSNTISYSFNKDIIGRQNAGGAHYQSALNGQRNTQLEQRGGFFQLMIGIPDESRIVTYAPLRPEKPLSRIPGPVLGVVELVQDMSSEYRAIYRVQIRVILTSSAVMLFLFLFLLLVVRKGEAIMERRARERTRLEEQLARAKHLSSLGEMTATISHEIRNPLGIIKSSAELLKKRMDKIDIGNTLPEIIVEEAARLNDIITDFLNFARPHQPVLRLARIEDIIAKNLQYLEPELDRRQIKVVRDIEDPLPAIAVDADMLYQAFLNLFLNALQAMDADGQLAITMKVVDRRLQIIIEDSGPGIDDAIMDKIWDPFFTNKEKGTGLGLGIVQNIIEAHNGTIRLDNASPGGTRVEIELPLQREPV
ncbi:MAG: two-component sensor histidine kinase [Desulfosarcina sp.]|nr:two-component sensor histidine kinase [Desulfobacterales bacterium]